MSIKTQHVIVFSVYWNIFLLTIGSALLAIGIQAAAVPHQLISSGVTGMGLLFYYFLELLSPGLWLLILSIPIIALGWFMISRRFILYTAYGMLATSGFMECIHFQIPLHDTLLAAIASGVLVGAGGGVCLRSLGSAGGTDIIGVILHKKFGFRIGQFTFLFNVAVFGVSAFLMDADLIMYSLISVFVGAQVTDYILSMFNQRKLVFIISKTSQDVTNAILREMRRGVTLLEGKGGYSGQKLPVIMTVVNNVQQKKLEEVIFSVDPEAMIIFENTFNVLGKGFSTRKVY